LAPKDAAIVQNQQSETSHGALCASYNAKAGPASRRPGPRTAVTSSAYNTLLNAPERVD